MKKGKKVTLHIRQQRISLIKSDHHQTSEAYRNEENNNGQMRNCVGGDH